MGYKVSVKEDQGIWEVDGKSVVRIDYNEIIGLMLPMMRLTILTTSIGLSRLTIGQKVTVEVEIEGVVHYFKMELVDIVSKKDPISESERVSTETVTINLLYGLEEWVNTSKIVYYENKSIYDVLTEEEVKAPDVLKGIGVQTWIRANTSKKRFIRELVRSTYLGEKDCPVTYIGQDGLVIKSLKDLVSGTSVGISDYPTEDLYMGIEGYSTNFSYSNIHIKKDPVYTVHDVVKNIVKRYDKRGNEISSNPDKSIQGFYLKDCGNTYPDYFKAIVRNDTAWLALSTERVGLRTTNPFRDSLNVLDSVEIKTKNVDERYSGKWLVTEKYITLTPTSQDLKGGYMLNRVDKEFYND